MSEIIRQRIIGNNFINLLYYFTIICCLLLEYSPELIVNPLYLTYHACLLFVNWVCLGKILKLFLRPCSTEIAIPFSELNVPCIACRRANLMFLHLIRICIIRRYNMINFL